MDITNQWASLQKKPFVPLQGDLGVMMELLEPRLLLSTIEGIVYDYDGGLSSPLEGIAVNVYQDADPNFAGPHSWQHVATDITDELGRYEVLNLTPRHYRVNVFEGQQADGYRYIGQNIYNVIVEDGTTTSEMDLDLRRAGHIYGYVYDSSEQPVEFAEILIDMCYTEEEDDGQWWHLAQTDATGRYDLYLAPTSENIYPVKTYYALNQGATYEVYGSNSPDAAGAMLNRNLIEQGFDYLGGSHTTATFQGSYEFYAIRVDRGNLVSVDAIEADHGDGPVSTTGWVNDLYALQGYSDGYGTLVGSTYGNSGFCIQYEVAPSAIRIHVVDQGRPAEPVYFAGQIAEDLYSAELGGTRGPDFYLSEGGLIRGRVVTPNGEPLANIPAVEPMVPIPGGELNDPDGWTGDDAEYWIPGIPPGVDVYLTTDDWSWQYEPDYAWGERWIGPFNLQPGEVIDMPDLVVPESASLEGFVTDGLGPVAGATVELVGVDIFGGAVWFDDDDGAITDGQGYYSFPTVPAGEFRLNVRHEGWVPWNSDGTVVLDQSEEATLYIQITPGDDPVSVSGSVANFQDVAPKNRDGVVLPYEIMDDYDDYGRPSEVGVIAFPVDTYWSIEDLLVCDLKFSVGDTRVTDGYEDYFQLGVETPGTFEFQMPAGPQIVVAYRSNGEILNAWSVLTGNSQIVDAEPGSAVSGLALEIPIGTSEVRGTVTFPGDYTQFVSEDAVMIYLREVGESSGLGRAIGSPGVDGQYVLPNIPAGEYYLFAVGRGLGPWISEPFILVEGQNVVVDIPMDYGAAVSGIVTGDGLPLAGATVESFDYEISTVTDENGFYWLGPLGFGYNVIAVSMDGYQSRQASVSPESGEEGILNFDLTYTSADLLIQEPDQYYLISSPGEMVSIDVTTFNDGGPAWSAYEGDFDTTIFLRSDTNFDPANEVDEVAEFQYSTLAAGEAHTHTYTFAAPAIPGTYYLRAMADSFDSVVESNEINNWGAIVTLNVELEAVETFPFSDYFPLELETQKLYAITINGAWGAVRAAVAPQKTEIHGIDTFEMQTYIGVYCDSSTFYSADEEGIKLHRHDYIDAGRAGFQLFDEPFLISPADVFIEMVSVTSGNWHGETNAGIAWSGTYTQQMNVLGFETVVIPAGTFECLKVEFHTISTKQGERWSSNNDNTATIWFSEGLGMVKQLCNWQEVSSAGTHQWVITYQLATHAGFSGTGPDLAPRLAEGSTLDVYVPGDRSYVPVEITNWGNAAAVGRIDLNLYASDDGLLDESDTPLCLLTGVPVNLLPGQSAIYHAWVTFPGDIAPGEYTILADVHFDGSMPDLNEDNNLAVGESTLEVRWRFGSFNGRRNVWLRVKDTNGTLITFALVGNGYGEIEGMGSFDRITLNGTDERSVFYIVPAPGSETAVTDIVVNGSIGHILGYRTDLLGDITVDGSLGLLWMDDVASDHLISIGSSENPLIRTVIYLDQVADLSISSATPIHSIIVTEWLDQDETPDEILAPYVIILQARGNPWTGIAGDFQANLTLTGIGAPGYSLVSAYVAGSLTNCTWLIDGDVNIINVIGDVNNWGLDLNSKINALYLGEVGQANVSVDDTIGYLVAKSWASGDLEADSAGTIWITGNHWTGLEGNFGANLTLWGENVANNWFALNTLYVDSFVRDNTISIMGNVGTFMAGAMRNSSLLLGCDQASGSAEDFGESLFTLRTFYLRGIAEEPGSLPVDYFEDSTVAAWNITGFIFGRRPETVSGTVQYHNLLWLVNEPLLAGEGMSWIEV